MKIWGWIMATPKLELSEVNDETVAANAKPLTSAILAVAPTDPPQPRNTK